MTNLADLAVINTDNKRMLDVSSLPESAFTELASFYEYLVYKEKSAAQAVSQKETTATDVAKKRSLQELFDYVNQNNIQLPEGYKFDREELQRYP